MVSSTTHLITAGDGGLDLKREALNAVLRWLHLLKRFTDRQLVCRQYIRKPDFEFLQHCWMLAVDTFTSFTTAAAMIAVPAPTIDLRS